MKKTFILLAIIFAGLALQAQKEKIELKLTLRDGNVISGKSTSITNVSLNTAYGKLEIPIKNITSLEFGIIPDESGKGKVTTLIKQMGDATETKRQAAYDELVKMGVNCIPVISDYIFGNEYQASEFTDYTPEDALIEMKNSYGVDDGYNDKDIVKIDYDYTMGGSFAIKTIALKTEYGELTIPKEKIKEVEVSCYDESAGDKSFKVLASKHITGNSDNGWLNTGIKVKKGQKISVKAAGEVTLESLSGNKYTPDGNASSDYESDYESSYPTYGNLVYKIGDDGSSVKAGSKYNGSANDSGVIYLSIYETVFNSSNTGFYTVKVSVK